MPRAPRPGASDPASVPPISAQEREQAGKLVDFSNTAANALTDGYYALPDALLDNARAYLQEWRLAPRPKVRAAERDAAGPATHARRGSVPCRGGNAIGAGRHRDEQSA